MTLSCYILKQRLKSCTGSLPRLTLVDLLQQVSHRSELQREEDSRKWEGSADRKQQQLGPALAAHALQAAQNVSEIH